jgi:hypothetical protein
MLVDMALQQESQEARTGVHCTTFIDYIYFSLKKNEYNACIIFTTIAISALISVE